MQEIQNIDILGHEKRLINTITRTAGRSQVAQNVLCFPLQGCIQIRNVFILTMNSVFYLNRLKMDKAIWQNHDLIS